MKGFPVVIVGTSMCSCDLFRPFKNNDAAAKYRRKGWSENKIARALQNRANAEVQSGLASDFRLWVADAADDCSEVFFFIHWDSDDLDFSQTLLASTSQLRKGTFLAKEERVVHLKNA